MVRSVMVQSNPSLTFTQDLPKFSNELQKEFFKLLSSLHLHEIQDFNMKAAAEFVRDLICIAEDEFDNWLSRQQTTKNNIQTNNEVI